MKLLSRIEEDLYRTKTRYYAVESTQGMAAWARVPGGDEQQ
jgi:hypothetical protein